MKNSNYEVKTCDFIINMVSEGVKSQVASKMNHNMSPFCDKSEESETINFENSKF